MASLSSRSLLRAAILAGMLVSASCFGARPAGAQLRLDADRAGPVQMTVMTWRDIPFRRIVRQRYDFSCGSAAVATLLTYHYGTPTSENEAFTAMWRNGDQRVIGKSGFSLLDMKQYLDSRGFHAEGFRIGEVELRQSRQPLIVLVEDHGFRHFVVVKGVRDDLVLIGDPIRGLMKVPEREFVNSWKGIVLAVTRRPANVRAFFNLDSEWTPWSVPPTTSVRDRTIGEITSNLPPVYQITGSVIAIPPVGIAP